MRSFPPAPTVDVIWSNWAFLSAVEYFKGMATFYHEPEKATAPLGFPQERLASVTEVSGGVYC
jgi:hypothetical protein